MSIIPIVSAKQVVTILLKAGFKIINRKGSHIRLQHPLTKRSTTVAMHVGDMSRRMLRMILNQAGISAREFLNLFYR